MGEVALNKTTNSGLVEGTTSFSISADAPSFHRGGSYLDPQNEIDVCSNDVKEIADFLAKPVPVGTGVFSTTNLWGDNLFNSDIYTLFKAQTIWVNKIQGFLSFRGDVKIRVVVNSTPFQAGLLRVSYFPCSDVLANEALMHRYNRQTISQMPGAYLNLQDNAVEVTIPYIAPPTFLERDVVSPIVPSWGALYVDVFEVLRTGTGPTTVNFTVWMSIENLELSGQVFPQMALDDEYNVFSRIKSDDYQYLRVYYIGSDLYQLELRGDVIGIYSSEGFHALSPEESAKLKDKQRRETLVELERFSPQMSDAPVRLRRPRRTINPLDGESNSGRGPLTTILDSGASLARSLMALPSLAPLALPTSWALAAAASAANTLGWSRPAITSDPVRMMYGNAVNTQNCDGGELTAPLSLSADNKLAVILDATPDSVDEMSFSFVNQVWSYWYDFQWATSATSGQQLTGGILSPFAMRSSSTLGGASVITMPACAFGHILTGFYRGGFEVKVTVVKTGYHTGTLAFSYVPGKSVPSTVSYSNTNYSYRSVFDIQDGNCFTFKVPYILPQSFLDVGGQIGVITLHVVNPLMAPATVASTCDIFLQIRGLPDLQYGVPLNPAYSPVVPQGAHVDQEDCVEKTLGDKVVDVDPIQHCQQSIGERVNSLLLLCKSMYTLSAPVGGANFGSKSITFQAHRFTGARYNGTIWTNAEFGGDPISLIASLYAFSRGSMRYRFSWSNNSTLPIQGVSKACLIAASEGALQNYYSNTSNAYTNALIGSTSNSGICVRPSIQPSGNGSLAVQVPFYSRYRYQLNQFIVAAGSGYLEYMPSNCIVLDQAGSDAVWMRSVGDDFHFSFFVGVPVMRSSPYHA